MFSVENSPLTFWAAPSSISNGRDPLAIQNSSVSIYTDLVVGITNATSRIRYMGFYCWVFNIVNLHLYQEDKLNYQNQLKYVRRAELLLAFITVRDKLSANATGIGGTDYARAHASDAIIDLAEGADRNDKGYIGTYLRNSTGIYYQYTALMASFGLIIPPFDNHKAYNVTDEGKKLSTAFSKNISPEAQSLFSNAIFTGKIECENIDLMLHFSLKAIPQYSDEDILYKRIMTGIDSMGNENRHRVMTMRLLLQYIKSNRPNVRIVVDDFLKQNYKKVIADGLTGPFEHNAWYLYELNELTHIGYEAFHFALMSVISETPMAVSEAINNLLGLMKSECVETYTMTLNQLPVNMCVHDIYTELMECYSEVNYGGKLILRSAELLKSLYAQNHEMFAAIDAISNDYKRNGYAVDLLNSIINEDTLKMSMEQFALLMIRKVMNDHIFSSFQKSLPGKKVVNNYMIEDGKIWKIRNTASSRTTPRLQNVLQYMEDLHWIDREEDNNNSYSFFLTLKGKEVLNGIN